MTNKNMKALILDIDGGVVDSVGVKVSIMLDIDWENKLKGFK